jgi:hypothetical protein
LNVPSDISEGRLGLILFDDSPFRPLLPREHQTIPKTRRLQRGDLTGGVVNVSIPLIDIREKLPDRGIVRAELPLEFIQEFRPVGREIEPVGWENHLKRRGDADVEAILPQ